MTQTWLADETVGEERPTYEPVSCLACSQQHFICIETGRALGDKNEQATATRGPAFPPKQIAMGIRSVPTSEGGLFAPLKPPAGHAKAH